MKQRIGIRVSTSVFLRSFKINKYMRKVLAMMLIAALLSNQAAAATLEAAPVLTEFGQDLRFEWYSSGWEKYFDSFLTSISPFQPNGIDSLFNKQWAQKAEGQSDRDYKIAKVNIHPGDVEIHSGEPLILAAVALDNDDNSISGSIIKWGGSNEETGEQVKVGNDGSFLSPIAGKFIVTADIAGSKNQVKVTVIGPRYQPRLKSTSDSDTNSVIKVDSRELRRQYLSSQQISMRSNGSEKNHSRKLNNKNLRAFSHSMVRVPNLYQTYLCGNCV